MNNGQKYLVTAFQSIGAHKHRNKSFEQPADHIWWQLSSESVILLI